MQWQIELLICTMQELMEHLEASKEAYDKHSADQGHQAIPNFTRGERVWLSTRSLKSTGLSAKLDDQYIGPFKNLEQINLVRFKLQLAELVKTHPVFHGAS